MMNIIINPRYEVLHPFVECLPDVFDQQGQTLHSGRNQVKLFETTNGGAWVVKRYKRPHLLQRLVYRWFRSSKAERAYRFALRLADMDIYTPVPLAYLEEKGVLLFGDSYFVAALCTDAPLYPVLVQAPRFDRELAARLAAFLVEMHAKGFLHGDLNLTNVLYRPLPDGHTRFSVIDTNRSCFKEHPSRACCLHNLVRLTHRRELLEFVVREYARLRGWSPEQAWQTVEAGLQALERKEERKRKWRRRKGK